MITPAVGWDWPILAGKSSCALTLTACATPAASHPANIEIFYHNITRLPWPDQNHSVSRKNARCRSNEKDWEPLRIGEVNSGWMPYLASPWEFNSLEYVLNISEFLELNTTVIYSRYLQLRPNVDLSDISLVFEVGDILRVLQNISSLSGENLSPLKAFSRIILSVSPVKFSNVKGRPQFQFSYTILNIQLRYMPRLKPGLKIHDFFKNG